MSLGDGVVKTMRKLFLISHTRLHEDHQYCIICKAGPFWTLEEMYDHIDAHPERLSGSNVQKDNQWIVCVNRVTTTKSTQLSCRNLLCTWPR